MEMWIHINGNDYPINYGQTITDNLGEELDSMSVIVSHVHDFSIKPYDDAYIHNMGIGGYSGRAYGSLHKLAEGEFYRHFIVYSYDRHQVNQNDGFYNFNIMLVSETKYLEKVLMPNRTITIPFNALGRSVFEMSEIFVDRYSPKIKVVDGENTWKPVNRFTVSRTSMFDDADKEELRKRDLLIVEDVFSDIQAAETSFNNPTLREALTKIFSVKNCIPVVFDGFVFARDLTQKGNELPQIKGVIWDTATMSGDEYCDKLRKNYANGLTDKNGCVFHEYVGFRNSNVASMRFSDLRIELKNPIYKINKFMLCFYSTAFGDSNDGHPKIHKIDMTSFVLPSSTRALLSNDYLSFERHRPNTVNGYLDFDGNYVLGLCDYKFMTVHYDIGSTEISGFGEPLRYTTDGIEYKQRTVLENIINYSMWFEIGDEDFENTAGNGFTDQAVLEENVYKLSYIDAKTPNESWYESFRNVAPALFDLSETLNVTSILTLDSLRMKSVFFEVEYQGMVSSAVMVSKDLHDGDICAIDNQQESLALMEQDGITSKFKANRLGNMTRTVTARVRDFGDLVGIGDYDDDHGICYKRVIGVEKDFISASYMFAKDYVLANYFTGVFSKYRSSAYASFAQSVERNENVDLQLYLTRYLPKDNKGVILRYPQGSLDYKYDFALSDVVSIFGDSKDKHESMAYFALYAPKPGEYFYDKAGVSQYAYQYYSADRARYMSGTSLCYTIGMPDSETAGTYVRQPFPDVTDVLTQALNASYNFDSNGMDAYTTYASDNSPINDITGTAQGFLTLPMSRSDGVVKNITFGLAFSDDGIQDNVYSKTDERTVEDIYDKDLYRLPLLSRDVEEQIEKPKTGRIEALERYKDAKEIINETFQIEPITGKGIRVSPYFLKLSDLFGGGRKRQYEIKGEGSWTFPLFACANFLRGYDYMDEATYWSSVKCLALYTGVGDLSLKNLNDLFKQKTINKEFEMLYVGHDHQGGYGFPWKLTLTVKRITDVQADHVKVLMSMSIEINDAMDVINYMPSAEGIVRIDVREFESVWWNFSMVHQRRMDYPAQNENFYDLAMPSPYAAYYYSDGNRICMCETVNRKCFVLDFDSFPRNTTLRVTYDDDQFEDFAVPNSSANLFSHVNAKTGETIDDFDRFVRFAMCGGFSMGVTNKYSDIGYTLLPRLAQELGIGTIPSDKDTAVTDRLDSYLRATERNMFWFGRNGEMPETFNAQRHYAELSDLLDDGFVGLDVTGTVSDESFSVKASGVDAGIGSVYLYYLDSDGAYHFVFGCDCAVDAQTGELSSTICASLVPDRSRTVYDAKMEPTLMTANYAGMDTQADNICVDKNQAS